MTNKPKIKVDGLAHTRQVLAQTIVQRDELLAALRDLVDVNKRLGAPPITKSGLCEENDWHYAMWKAQNALTAAAEGRAQCYGDGLMNKSSLRELEIIRASLVQCSAISSAKQLREVAKECADKLQSILL